MHSHNNQHTHAAVMIFTSGRHVLKVLNLWNPCAKAWSHSQNSVCNSRGRRSCSSAHASEPTQNQQGSQHAQTTLNKTRKGGTTAEPAAGSSLPRFSTALTRTHWWSCQYHLANTKLVHTVCILIAAHQNTHFPTTTSQFFVPATQSHATDTKLRTLSAPLAAQNPNPLGGR